MSKRADECFKFVAYKSPLPSVANRSVPVAATIDADASSLNRHPIINIKDYILQRKEHGERENRRERSEGARIVWVSLLMLLLLVFKEFVVLC